MTAIPPDEPVTRLFLRHALARLAYRASKTVRGTTGAFGTFRTGEGAPSAVEILAHMGDLMDWALTQVRGETRWSNATPLAWDEEIARFHRSLGALEAHLASGAPIACEPGRLFQGAIADALTHTGQLAMLRRLSGHKMKGENYSRADIEAGRVGPDQVPPDPRFEFD